MSYFVREAAGWGLVVLGVLMFLIVYDYCERRWIFEAGILGVIGIFVFRGGIHLLKVAVAARVCQQAQEKLAAAPPVTGIRAGTAPRSSAPGRASS